MYLVRFRAQAKLLFRGAGGAVQRRALTSTTQTSNFWSGAKKKAAFRESVKTGPPLWDFMVPRSQRPPIVCEYVRETDSPMHKVPYLAPEDLDGRGKKGLLTSFCGHCTHAFALSTQSTSKSMAAR